MKNIEKTTKEFTITKISYKKIAQHFSVDYMYVYQIAQGKRRCIRGKAKAIKELIKSLKNDNQL